MNRPATTRLSGSTAATPPPPAPAPATANLPVAAAVLSIAVALALVACGDQASAPTMSKGAPIAVEVRLAETTQVAELIVATAAVEPARRVSPGTKILGRVDEVAVEEGDRVRRGALLARLESRDLEAALDQARAAIAMADATLENASTHHARIAKLNERGSATDKNLEDALAALRVAGAAKRQAEADLAAAEIDAGYAEIRSPIAGVVVAKRIEAGDMATPGAPLFTIEDLSRVELDVRMPEAQIGGVAEGAPATATIGVIDQRYETVVARVVPAGDPVSRTYSVTLLLDNRDGEIKSGMFARVELPRGERDALLVPRSAVVERGQLRGIYVVDAEGGGEARSRLRWIKVREGSDADRIEVLSGLEPGERYVTAPPAGLVDGSVVEATGETS
jgi:RND family efflux transporter MFP subunit